ncbi:MAG: MFS transporter, partial [Pseudomonadota bacterium]
ALLLERFSFYGIRTLLILYMLNVLKFDRNFAGSIYGWMLLLAAVMPLFGGILSDKWLGAKRALVWACASVAIADIIMAFSSVSSSTIALYTAIVFLAIGLGLFRPSYYTILGNLYSDRNDARRDSGFTFIFLATNVGAVLAPLSCGYIGENVHFGLGFLVAGLAALGAVLMVRGIKEPKITNASVPRIHNVHKIYVLAVIAVIVIFIWQILSGSNDTFNSVFSGVTDVVLKKNSRFLPLSMFAFGIILSPLFTWYWTWSSHRGRVTPTFMKFFMGMMLAAFTFLALYILFMSYQKSGVISLYGLMAVNLLFIAAEMFIGPIANAAVTRIAPPKYVGTTVGVWVLLTGGGGIAGAMLVPSYNAGSKMIFIIPFAVAVISAILILVLQKPLKKWMHGIN